jgi:hypothetical protein
MTGLVLYTSLWFDRPAAIYLIQSSKTSNAMGHQAAAEKLAMVIGAKRFSITERPVEDARYFNVPLRQVLVIDDRFTIW